MYMYTPCCHSPLFILYTIRSTFRPSVFRGISLEFLQIEFFVKDGQQVRHLNLEGQGISFTSEMAICSKGDPINNAATAGIALGIIISDKIACVEVERRGEIH